MAYHIFYVVLIVCSGVDYSFASGSSGAGPAQQMCSTDNINVDFYCPVPGIMDCRPGEQRCTGTNACIDPDTGREEGCYESSIAGRYTIRLGHANIGSSGSKKKIFEHRFISYRGFTYEFGDSYNVQILDNNDPDYKYINGRELNSGGIESIGTSSCTTEEANQFADTWRSKNYYLIFQDCQRFASAMKKYLTESPCSSRSPTGRKKRQFEDEVEQQVALQLYLNSLHDDCSIVCCASNSFKKTAVSAIVIVASFLLSYVTLI